MGERGARGTSINGFCYSYPPVCLYVCLSVMNPFLGLSVAAVITHVFCSFTQAPDSSFTHLAYTRLDGGFSFMVMSLPKHLDFFDGRPFKVRIHISQMP